MRRLIWLSLLSAATPVLAGPTLLVGNKGEDTVSFIDLSDGNERVRVPTGKMPHEIAVSADGKQLNAAETVMNQVAEVDFASGEVLRRFTVGKNGDGLAMAP